MTVHNLLARIVGAREAIEVRDLEYADGILADLEQEVARATGADRRPHTCASCTFSARWLGENSDHQRVAHPPDDVADDGLSFGAWMLTLREEAA